MRDAFFIFEVEMDYLEVGKIRDAHGLKGEVFIVPFSQKSDWIEKTDSLRVVRRRKDEDGQWVEDINDYTIARKKPHKVGYIVKFEELKTRNDSEALKGARIQVPKSLLVSEPGETIYLNELINFQVTSKEGKTLGQVVGFSSNGPQDLLVVESGSGKYEVPLVEAFIVRINWEKNEIVMDIPEGLIG